jgi:hypothetical protein
MTGVGIAMMTVGSVVQSSMMTILTAGHTPLFINFGPCSISLGVGSGFHFGYLGAPENTVFDNVMYFLATVGVVVEINAIGDSYAAAAPRAPKKAMPEPRDVPVVPEEAMPEPQNVPVAPEPPAPLRGQEPLGSELRYTPEQVASGEHHRYMMERQFHHLLPAEKATAIAELNARQQAYRTSLAEQAVQGRETIFGVDYEPNGYYDITELPAAQLPAGLGWSLPKNPEQLIAHNGYGYQFRSIDIHPNKPPVIAVHHTGANYRAVGSHFLEWVRRPR